MAYDLYCQVIDSVLLSDTLRPHQLNFMLREVDSKFGNDIAHKVESLYKTNRERSSPKDHVEVYGAVCEELLSHFTLPKLFMSLYFATKYLAFVQDVEHLTKDESNVLRRRLSCELKFIVKNQGVTNLQGVSLLTKLCKPWLMIAGGVTIGLLSIITYQQIKGMF